MQPHIFADNPMDRGERERRDEDWLRDRANDSTSRFLPMLGHAVLLTDDAAPGLGWVSLSDLRQEGEDLAPLLLGMMDGTTHFVVDLTSNESLGRRLMEGGNLRFEDARAAAQQVSGPEAGILAQGRAQLNWHNRHGFCSVCGHPTEIQRGGQKRVCPQCSTEHFPRTDPVVITVVHDQDLCLLGQSRGRLAATNRYSALAGFMDQAETIEEAVAREIMEESGIQVKNVRYHSSQPLPFPSSLMIGCHAEAATTDIHMDDDEMTDVQWFERREVLLAREGQSERLAIPEPIAIAHHLIRAWANGEVSR